MAAGATIRPTCDLNMGGWYHQGFWIKFKAVMKTKLVAIQFNRTLEPNVFDDILVARDTTPPGGQPVSFTLPALNLTEAEMTALRGKRFTKKTSAKRQKAPRVMYMSVKANRLKAAATPTSQLYLPPGDELRSELLESFRHSGEEIYDVGPGDGTRQPGDSEAGDFEGFLGDDGIDGAEDEEDDDEEMEYESAEHGYGGEEDLYDEDQYYEDDAGSGEALATTSSHNDYGGDVLIGGKGLGGYSV
jgi:general transcription factor 3C polypeptide 5 (transcription factor C subunit 1)